MIRKELQKQSLRRAIRERCLDCCCGQIKEVRLCNIKTCALWPYRSGRSIYEDPASGKIYKCRTNDEVIDEE